MAFKQGRFSEIVVSGIDMSAYLDTIEMSREAELHETTTFTKTSKTWLPGLQDGTVDIAGKYDPSNSGPAQLLPSLMSQAQAVPVKYYPGGKALNQAIRIFNAFVVSYNESSPVGDVVAFNASLQIDGPVTYTVSGLGTES
jgi:hypothetical protein